MPNCGHICALLVPKIQALVSMLLVQLSSNLLFIQASKQKCQQ